MDRVHSARHLVTDAIVGAAILDQVDATPAGGAVMGDVSTSRTAGDAIATVTIKREHAPRVAITLLEVVARRMDELGVDIDRMTEVWRIRPAEYRDRFAAM